MGNLYTHIYNIFKDLHNCDAYFVLQNRYINYYYYTGVGVYV